MSKELALPFPSNTITGETVLRLPRVKDRTGISRASIYAGVRKKTFPAPIKLGERAVGWLASEIEAWLQSRKESRQAQEVAA